MAQKILIHDGKGGAKQLEPNVSSTGAGDAGKVIALDPSGKLDGSLMPVGIGADTAALPASEILAAGELVNIWSDAGVSKVRLADATTSGKEADGFVLSAYAALETATVYFGGINTQLTGMTPGTQQYLNTVAGGITETPPTVAGNVVQSVGKAISATELSFERGYGIELV